MGMKYLISCSLLAALLLFAACTPRPSKAELRRAEKHAQDSIALEEQRRSLEYYQSQLEQLQPVADSLLTLFQYEKQEKYQDHGFYGFRVQQSQRNTNRSYLQVLVRDDGQPLVRCYYYGAQRIGFEQVELAVGDMAVLLSGSSHAFEAEGWHQMLTLTDSAALQAMKWADAYASQRVRVRYMEHGRAGFVFYLSEADKTAMRQACQLSVVMSDIYELEKRIRRTSLEVEKYQKRLQKAETFAYVRKK